LLYCHEPRNLQTLQSAYGVTVRALGDTLALDGPEAAVARVVVLFDLLELARSQGLKLRQADFEALHQAVLSHQEDDYRKRLDNPLTVRLKRSTVVPKTLRQKAYLECIMQHDITFGIGPAGTGKTYLAVAMALQALLENKVERVVVTRPAVEAGEALGFLPGDLREKILPYLRPLYDAMYEMLGAEETEKLIERNIIEVAPLAYMRGRTLSQAYVLLDEAQNTTPEQMLMFLTRLGDNSRMVITGDITQVDLPKKRSSGLRQALRVLTGVQGIGLFAFDASDVVRHPLVQRIIDAYQKDSEQKQAYTERRT
jgi:phosphate starvation-inducible PhoH-like protein